MVTTVHPRRRRSLTTTPPPTSSTLSPSTERSRRRPGSGSSSSRRRRCRILTSNNIRATNKQRRRCRRGRPRPGLPTHRITAGRRQRQPIPRADIPLPHSQRLPVISRRSQPGDRLDSTGSAGPQALVTNEKLVTASGGFEAVVQEDGTPMRRNIGASLRYLRSRYRRQATLSYITVRRQCGRRIPGSTARAITDCRCKKTVLRFFPHISPPIWV